MSKTALITGASSGIGAEIARYHAKQGGDLVLVARNEPAMEHLKQELEAQYKVKATIVVADLAVQYAAQDIFQKTEADGIQVDMLINNAGFGGHGKFQGRDLAKDQAMMQVNMNALVDLTHLYMRGMIHRNQGRILHVASTAGFMPGPLQAVYYATKAFVVSFSQAISQELANTNVTSTVLCPGTVDTGFVAAGNLEGVSAWDNAASPQSVAKCGYDAMLKGELVSFNERGLRFMLNWIMPLMSRRMVLKSSEKFMQKQ